MVYSKPLMTGQGIKTKALIDEASLVKYPLAGMIHWSMGTRLDESQVKSLMARIRREESFIAPLRRDKAYIGQVLCGLFQAPEKAYEQMHQLYINADSNAINPLSTDANMALLGRMLDDEDGNQGINHLFRTYKQLKKEHPVLVDRHIKPYLLNKRIEIETVNTFYDALLELDFVACKGLLWLSIFLAGKGNNFDLAKMKLLEEDLKKIGLVIQPDDYLLLGYIASKVERVDQALDYSEERLQALLHQEVIKEFGAETLLFFTMNRFLFKANAMPDRSDLYDYVLVLNQLISNNTSVQNAVQTL